MGEMEKILAGIWGGARDHDRAAISQRLQMLRGEWRGMVRAEIRRTFSKESEKRLLPIISTEVNIFRRIVEERAMVYKEAPRRVVKDAAGAEIPRWAEIVDESRLNIVMKQANFYTQGMNNCLLKIVARNAKIEIDIFTPDAFTIYTDAADWKKIRAIAVEIGTRIPQVGEDLTRRMENPLEIWTAETTVTQWGTIPAGKVAIIRGGAIETMADNRYTQEVITGYMADGTPEKKTVPFLPFVLLSKNFPIDGLIDLKDGAEIVHSNVGFAIQFTLLNEVIKYQSSTQVFMVGPKDADFPDGGQLGPWSALAVKANNPQGVQVGTLQLQTDPTKLWSTIVERITFFAAQFGVPPSAFIISKSPQSGISMKIERRGLEEARANDIELYRIFERDIFNAARIVNNAHHPVKIPMDAGFSIDFADPKFDYTADEIIKMETHELANNLTTAAKLIRKRNPDLSEFDAAKEAEENAMVNLGNQPNPEFSAAAGLTTPGAGADLAAQ